MFRVGIYHPANAAPGTDARGGGYHEAITHVFKFQQAVPPVHEKEVKEA
jgi:hypothetical protein